MDEPIVSKKPIDYVKMVFRRKWLIMVPVAISVAVGVIACNVLPKEYQSSTLILVEEGRVINPLIEGLAVSTSVAQRLAVLREQILGWDRVNQLIKKLNLAKDVKTQQDFENLVKELRKSIVVRLRGNNIIGISYLGKDPAGAMNIVKTITDIFIEENLRQQNQETDSAITFINDQLEVYQKKLKQAEIDAKQQKLNDLLIDSTPKHPMVQELKKEIEVAAKELEAGNYLVDASTIAGSDQELINMKDELKTLKQEIAASTASGDSGANRTQVATSSNDKLYKLLLLEKVERVTAKDEGVTKTLYNELLKRLETAKLTQRLEASKEGTRYTILDPARMPLKPVKPNKPMVLFMSLFFGFCCGLGLVFLAEVYDHSFLGVDEARSYFDLPILGAISKIITESDVREQRLRNIKVTSISVLVATVLMVIVIFNVFLGS
ncbi:polysaccharide chain length determinant protein [sediment metagenome]|uniref:Polysaccharide chain length determinant protein n=1 Tax=sediment metagenome TaxID=749907 RepID=D9PKL2_9ZZZZ